MSDKEDLKEGATVKELLKKFSQRIIAFPPIYARITGSVTAGLLITQLAYYHYERGETEFKATDEEFARELGMGLYELKGAKTRLTDLNLITIQRRGIPATTYYTLNTDELISLITSYGKNPQLVQTHNKTREKAVSSDGKKPEQDTAKSRDSKEEMVLPDGKKEEIPTPEERPDQNREQTANAVIDVPAGAPLFTDSLSDTSKLLTENLPLEFSDNFDLDKPTNDGYVSAAFQSENKIITKPLTNGGIPSSQINKFTLNTDFDFDIPSPENIDADFDTLSPEEFRQKYSNPVVLAISAIRFLKVRLEQTENELAHDPNNKRLLDDLRAYQDEIVKEKKKLDSFKSSIHTEISKEISRVV